MPGMSSSAGQGRDVTAAASSTSTARGLLAATPVHPRREREHLCSEHSLPAISEDTGMDVTTLQWAVTGHSLVGAAVIVTSGSLGDVFGRKRVFRGGLLLFVVSCVFIAVSSSGGAVIAGRVVQGAAGSTILACGLSLLSVANSGQAQLRAVSLWVPPRLSGQRRVRSWVGCSSNSPGGRGCSGSTRVSRSPACW